MSEEGLKIRDNKTELKLKKFNPFTPFSLQHSPESNIQVTRIKEMITN